MILASARQCHPRRWLKSQSPGITAYGVAAMLTLSSIGGASAGDRAQDCAKLQHLKIPASAIGLATAGATVTSALLITGLEAGGPSFEYCRVIGVIAPTRADARTGTPPINFQINLPTNWNGKAVHMGGGGYNGTIVTGLTPVLHILGVPPIRQGYATYGSDSGHTGLLTNADFGANPAALKNFAYEHIKKTHDAALVVTAEKYGRRPTKSYFAGASTGGREGLTAVERYSQDYDGVVINAPAIYFSGMRLIGLRIGAAAYESTAGFVSTAKFDALRAAVLKACDADDGLADGVVSDIASCRAKEASITEAVKCPVGQDSSACLTEAQIKTVRAIADDLVHPYPLAYGVRDYPGYNILQGADFARGLGMGTSPAALSPPQSAENGYMYSQGDAYIRNFVTRERGASSFKIADPGRFLHRLQTLSEMIGAMNPDTAAFQARGGKLLVTHGLADDAVSPNGTIKYYNEQIARFGQEKVDTFFRLYMVPGFGHGFGAFIPSWNGVEVLDKWVAGGQRPDTLTATDVALQTAGRTRPLCVFPKFPRYKGQGAANDASNFECVSGTEERK